MDQYQRNRQASNRIMSSKANRRVIEQHPTSPGHPPTITSDVPDAPNTTISTIMGAGPALEQENSTYAAAYKLHAEAQARIRQREQEAIHKLNQNKEKAPKSPSSFKKVLRTLTPNRKESKSSTGLNIQGMPEDKQRPTPQYDFNQHRRAYMTGHRPTTPSPIVMSPQMQPGTQTYPIPQRAPNEPDARIQANASVSQQPFPRLNPALLRQPQFNHTIRDSYAIALGRPITIADPDTHQTPSAPPTPTNTKSYTIPSRSRPVSRPSIRSHHDVENSIHNPTSQLARSIFSGPPVIKFAADELPNEEHAVVDSNETKISDAYIVAAFDGLHRHIEEVKKEVIGRMEVLEGKMDCVLGFLSARTSDAGVGDFAGGEGERKREEQGKGKENENENENERERHTPSGGRLEGWFEAVKE